MRDNFDDACAKASGDGQYRFSLRQLFYVLRPLVMAATGKALEYGNFEAFITDHEAKEGETPGIYRDNRGVLYQPHSGLSEDGEKPLGTLMVESYARPAWTFNKIIYIEKQGFFELLKDQKWPERHDCALITSKGFASRAAKDLIDKLVETGEPIQVFVVHDSDAAGTMIVQTLRDETKARGARQVEVINIGLDPWEAAAMNLPEEAVEWRGKKEQAVAQYVKDYDAEHGTDYEGDLGVRRTELNAMTSPEFLEWLTSKMEAHGAGKVIPPVEVMLHTAQFGIEYNLERRVRAKVMAELDIEGQVAARLTAAKALVGLPTVSLDAAAAWLERRPERTWNGYAFAVADGLTGEIDDADL